MTSCKRFASSSCFITWASKQVCDLRGSLRVEDQSVPSVQDIIIRAREARETVRELWRDGWLAAKGGWEGREEGTKRKAKAARTTSAGCLGSVGVDSGAELVDGLGVVDGLDAVLFDVEVGGYRWRSVSATCSFLFLPISPERRQRFRYLPSPNEMRNKPMRFSKPTHTREEGQNPRKGKGE
jgi:hypothetical protein